MARSRSKPGVTLGFIGSGKVGKNALTTLISDLIESEGGTARFVLPVTKEHFSEGVQALADYAIDNHIDYDAVVDDEASKKRDLKPYIEKAVRLHRVARIPQKIVNILVNGENPKLIVLYEEEDAEVMTALEKAEDSEIEAFDLTDGLELIELSEGSSGEGDGKEEPEEEPEPSKSRRRSKAEEEEEEEEPPRRRRRAAARDEEEPEEPEEEPEPEEPEELDAGLDRLTKLASKLEDDDDRILADILLALVAALNNIADAVRNPVKRGPGRPPGSKNRPKDD